MLLALVVCEIPLFQQLHILPVDIVFPLALQRQQKGASQKPHQQLFTLGTSRTCSHHSVLHRTLCADDILDGEEEAAASRRWMVLNWSWIRKRLKSHGAVGFNSVGMQIACLPTHRRGSLARRSFSATSPCAM